MPAHLLKIYSALGICLCLLFLGACQPIRQPLSSNDQESRLGDQKHWQASGKISLRFHGESNTASFMWRQDQQDYQIHLFGPFGQGSVWLRKQRDQVSLSTADKPSQTAASAEQLMLDNLGWQVPVSNMIYWIRGLAAPATQVDGIEFDSKGFLHTLEQQGWSVQIRRRERFGIWTLPAKLVATRDDVKILMVIKDWKLTRMRKR